jgi:hypothetical protein
MPEGAKTRDAACPHLGQLTRGWADMECSTSKTVLQAEQR